MLSQARAFLGLTGNLAGAGTGVEWSRKLEPEAIELPTADVYHRIGMSLPAEADEVAVNLVTGVATPAGTAVLTFGGAGKDREGATLPSVSLLRGLKIKCTAGAVDVSRGAVLFTLTAGDVFAVAGTGVANSLAAFFGTALEVTAGEDDSVVEIEVMGES